MVDGGPRSGVIREGKSPSQVRTEGHTEDKDEEGEMFSSTLMVIWF